MMLMRHLLFLVLLFCCQSSWAQPGMQWDGRKNAGGVIPAGWASWGPSSQANRLDFHLQSRPDHLSTASMSVELLSGSPKDRWESRAAGVERIIRNPVLTYYKLKKLKRRVCGRPTQGLLYTSTQDEGVGGKDPSCSIFCEYYVPALDKEKHYFVRLMASGTRSAIEKHSPALLKSFESFVDGVVVSH